MNFTVIELNGIYMNKDTVVLLQLLLKLLILFITVKLL